MPFETAATSTARGKSGGRTDLVVGEVEPTDALVHITFTVMGALARVAAEHDVSLIQLRVFGILRDRTPRMAELADFLGLEKSTMCGLISRADPRGVVERRPSADDARATEVVMTKAGLALARPPCRSTRHSRPWSTGSTRLRSRSSSGSLSSSRPGRDAPDRTGAPKGSSRQGVLSVLR